MLSTTTQDIMDLNSTWVLNLVQQTFNVVHKQTGNHGLKQLQKVNLVQHTFDVIHNHNQI
jgi:hypothetical protein